MKSSEKTEKTDELDLEGDLSLSGVDVAQNQKRRVQQGDVAAYLEFLDKNVDRFAEHVMK